MPRHYINCPDVFCYICVLFITKTQRMKISEFVKKTYLVYFGCKLGDQDKTWVPHMVCKHCTENLRQWSKGQKKSTPFGVPMMWREQTDYFNDCYFCVTKVQGFSKRTKGNIQYSNLPSAIRLVPYNFII